MSALGFQIRMKTTILVALSALGSALLFCFTPKRKHATKRNSNAIRLCACEPQPWCSRINCMLTKGAVGLTKWLHPSVNTVILALSCNSCKIEARVWAQDHLIELFTFTCQDHDKVIRHASVGDSGSISICWGFVTGTQLKVHQCFCVKLILKCGRCCWNRTCNL